MANYTPNYQLHQWEPEDPFLRTDFNEDFQKIDSAILIAKSSSGCIVGTYTGNGSRMEFSLGVHPKLIVLTAPHVDSSRSSDTSLAIGTSHCMIAFDSYGRKTYSKITFQENGFVIDDSHDDGLNGAGQINSYAVIY